MKEDLLKRLYEDGAMGCDFSLGNPNSKEAAEEIEKLRAALRSIQCPSCHGDGKSPDPFDREGRPCFGCKGTGIHPTAREALEFQR